MNTPALSTIRLRSLAPLAPLALPVVCLFWAYWPTLGELARTWAHNPQYQHGFLVPLFAGILLYLRRDKLEVQALSINWWGAALLAVGLGMRLVGTYRYYVSLDSISLVPCVAGLVLFLGGWAAWRWAWPSVLFLGFMIPLPYFVAVAMSGSLQRLATVVSTFVMQTLGMPALAEGNVILINDHSIGIVEACSGLRMLVVFFALATAVVLLTNRHWIDRVIIILSAVPIALISNILRVTMTGIMYDMGHSEMANAFFHDVAGYFMMPLALGLLWVELKVLERLFIDAPALPKRTPLSAPARRAAAQARPAVPRTRRSTQIQREKPTETPVSVEQGVKQS